MSFVVAAVVCLVVPLFFTHTVTSTQMEMQKYNEKEAEVDTVTSTSTYGDCTARLIAN